MRADRDVKGRGVQAAELESISQEIPAELQGVSVKELIKALGE